MTVRHKPSISITLPKSVFNWIDQEAERTNRSRSQMISAIILNEMNRSAGKPAYVLNESFSAYSDTPGRSLNSPMDYIIKLARSGVRSLDLPLGKSPEAACEILKDKQPTLMQMIRDLAASVPVDPGSLQLFNERFWPFPLNELDALRSIYALVWRDAHS